MTLTPGGRDTVDRGADRLRDMSDARAAVIGLYVAVIIVAGAGVIGLAIGLAIRAFRIASGT